MLRLSVVFLSLLFVSVDSSAEYSSCDSWYHRTRETEENVSMCACDGLVDHTVKCESNWRVRVLVGHCMTTDRVTKEIVTGACPFSSLHDLHKNGFVLQPRESYELTNFTCGELNRCGRLCSHCCNDSHGVSMLSYSYKCVPCPSSTWSIYIGAGVIPMTLFVVLVLAFQLPASSPQTNAVIFILQTTLHQMNAIPGLLVSRKSTTINVLVTIAGFWNLDIFRWFVPHFCIKNTSTLQILALDYILTFYPLILIPMIGLFSLLPWNRLKMMQLNHKWLSRCRQPSMKNFRALLAQGFATFIVLGYSKVLYINIALLSMVDIASSDRNSTKRNCTSRFTLYNASVPYLSSEHIPYFILAMVILALQILLPLFLIIHQVRPCSKLLRRNPHFTLHLFNNLSNSFKNGSEGSWDHRSFFAIYFIMHLLLWLPGVLNMLYVYITLVSIPLIMSFIVEIFSPYKEKYWNHRESTWFFFFTMGQILSTSGIFMYSTLSTYIILHFLLIVPLVYLGSIYTAKVLRYFKVLQWLHNLYKIRNQEHRMMLSIDKNGEDQGVHSSEDHMADRVENPEDYSPPLLIGGVNHTYGSLSQSN